ncbi:hypothetical protein D3C84_980360 [compost metagenome]
MRSTPKSSTAERRIQLSASVPPEVKIISWAEQFKCLAILFLESSKIVLPFRPKLCVDDGLPKSSVITLVIS